MEYSRLGTIFTKVVENQGTGNSRSQFTISEKSLEKSILVRIHSVISCRDTTNSKQRKMRRRAQRDKSTAYMFISDS